MKNLCPPFLAIILRSYTTCPAVTAVGVVAVVERKEDLHKVVPDSVFGNESVVSLCLLDDGAEVATTTVFHKDVEDASLSVNVSVMIAYNMFVVEVLEDVP